MIDDKEASRIASLWHGPDRTELTRVSGMAGVRDDQRRAAIFGAIDWLELAVEVAGLFEFNDKYFAGHSDHAVNERELSSLCEWIVRRGAWHNYREDDGS